MEYLFQKYLKSDLIQNHLKMGGSNAKGETIGINSLYFTKSGEPWIGTMGEYHYARANHADWHRELCKMKAGGIEIVSTYVFWNYHEEDEGVFDFTGNNNIHGFLKCALDAGLEICLRLGPWINAECRNGGFPDWLLNKQCKRRSNDPGYLHLVERFWKKLYEQVHDLPLLSIQIENELVDDAEHILRLKQMALEIGFKAPIYTATGWNGVGGAKLPLDEVVPVFGGYPEAPWERHMDKLAPSSHFFFNRMRNDTAIGADLMVQSADDGWRLPYERYPFATCEMGGGVQIGQHRRPIINPMDVYTLSLVELGSGNNLVGYYMYHGGTNQIGKHTTLNIGYCPIRNYDFQAPISQYGEIREHYRLLNLLNLFVADYGKVLAPMKLVESQISVGRHDRETLRYCMRTDGESGFVFINHYQRLDQLKDVDQVVLNTGCVTFPPMDIHGEICFFMPFNLKMGALVLEYATAQPICIVENTFFFAAIKGIEPVFKFRGKEEHRCRPGIQSVLTEGSVTLVVLSWQEALAARKLHDKLYLGIVDGKMEDLYEEGGEIKAASESNAFSYYEWNGMEFIRQDVQKGNRSIPTNAVLRREVCEQPFDIPEDYASYLHRGHPRQIAWYRLHTDTDRGWIQLDDVCDTAQLYVDGVLAADQFYYGKPWSIPAKMLFGKECYLAVSPIENDFYREFDIKT